MKLTKLQRVHFVSELSYNKVIRDCLKLMNQPIESQVHYSELQR